MNITMQVQLNCITKFENWFFDECAVQRVHDENPDSERFVLNEALNEPYNDIASYVGRMMRSSGELMTFLVGGSRFFKNNAIIECSNEWT